MMLLRSPGQLPVRIIPGVDRHSAQYGGWGGGPARVHHGHCISDVRFQYGDVVRKEENSPMWYGSTKNLLESIVRGLRTEAPQNADAWQAQTELVQVCLAEMVEMSEPTVNPSKGGTSRYVHRPVADKLNRAMPHVRFMLTAMRDRDRTTALVHGETTLRRL